MRVGCINQRYIPKLKFKCQLIKSHVRPTNSGSLCGQQANKIRVDINMRKTCKSQRGKHVANYSACLQSINQSIKASVSFWWHDRFWLIHLPPGVRCESYQPVWVEL